MKNTSRQADNITDQDRLRHYRTELPNIIDDFGLSVYAHRLYSHYKRACGTGSCEQGVRYIAKLCRMSTGMVSKAKKELVECGLIWIEPSSIDADTVTMPDLWEYNFPIYHLPAGENRDQAIADMKRSLCEHPKARSSHEHLRSRSEHPRSPHERKKEPFKKEQSKKEQDSPATPKLRFEPDQFYPVLKDEKIVINKPANIGDIRTGYIALEGKVLDSQEPYTTFKIVDDYPTNTSPKTTVVNIHKLTADQRAQVRSGEMVYIGRANKTFDLPASIWENSYHIDKDHTREQVVADYRAYILKHPALLKCIPDLRGKTLVCYCHPAACHGDVLAELANMPPDELQKLVEVATSTKSPQKGLGPIFDAWIDAVGRDTLPAGFSFGPYMPFMKKLVDEKYTEADLTCAGQLIKAWRDALPGKPPVKWEVGIVTNQIRQALALCKDSVSAQDVTAFVKARYAQTDANGKRFWAGKLVTFEHAADNIAVWKADQQGESSPEDEFVKVVVDGVTYRQRKEAAHA